MKKQTSVILLMAIVLLLFQRQLFLTVPAHAEMERLTSNDSIENNKRLINELKEERVKNNRLETELSNLRGMKPQRIALMFSGAPRTLTQAGVMTSHVVNVINALGADGRDIVDVFFHLNNGTSDAVIASHNGNKIYQKPFTEDILEKLVNLTTPVQVDLYTDSSCSGLNGTISRHSCCRRRWPKAHEIWKFNFLQFAYLRESYRSVKRYEREHDLTYDWFVRIRPDVACFESMPAVRSLSTRRFYLQTKERPLRSNTNDYIFIVPRNLSDLFFEEQIMNIFETNCPRGMSVWPAEATMFKYSPSLPYQVLPLPCVHVTSPTTAECFRFSRREQPSVPTIYGLDGSVFAKGESFEVGCNKAVQNGYFGS